MRKTGAKHVQIRDVEIKVDKSLLSYLPEKSKETETLPVAAPRKTFVNETKSKQLSAFEKSAKTFGIQIPKQLYQQTKPKQVNYIGIELNKPNPNNNTVSEKSLDSKDEEAKPDMSAYVVSLPTISDTFDDNAREILKALESEESLSKSTPIHKFECIARDFFNSNFIIGKHNCRIIEVEFYTYPDLYFPQDPLLSTFHKFCFGRISKNEFNNQYPTYEYCYGIESKLYISISEEKYIGGMLIKSISIGDRIIEGSDKVVEFILKEFKVDNVMEMVRLMQNSGQKVGIIKDEAYSINIPLFPIRIERYIDDDKNKLADDFIIYNSPRIGLLEKSKDIFTWDHAQYIMLPYRFSFCPGKLKIGRALFVVTAELKEIPNSKIVEDCKCSPDVIIRWSSYYLKGKICNFNDFIDGEYSDFSKPKSQLYAYGFFSNVTK